MGRGCAAHMKAERPYVHHLVHTSIQSRVENLWRGMQPKYEGPESEEVQFHQLELFKKASSTDLLLSPPPPLPARSAASCSCSSQIVLSRFASFQTGSRHLKTLRVSFQCHFCAILPSTLRRSSHSGRASSSGGERERYGNERRRASSEVVRGSGREARKLSSEGEGKRLKGVRVVVGSASREVELAGLPSGKRRCWTQ